MPDIQYSFGTGEGDPNVHHTEANVDVDGDGVADGVALDFDGDGRVDDVMWDSDGDGVADTALLDENDDGVAEDAYNDPTGMGTWNAHGQGGHAQQAPQPQQQPEPQPSPGPTDGHDQDDPNPGGDTDNGYEPYNTNDGGDDDGSHSGDVPGELPEGHDSADDTDHNQGSEMPGGDDTGTGDTGDSGSEGYEPRDDDTDGDANPMFDNLDDAPDVDRDSVSEWYDDMMT
jgi:hypothetical protein